LQSAGYTRGAGRGKPCPGPAAAPLVRLGTRPLECKYS